MLEDVAAVLVSPMRSPITSPVTLAFPYEVASASLLDERLIFLPVIGVPPAVPVHSKISNKPVRTPPTARDSMINFLVVLLFRMYTISLPVPAEKLLVQLYASPSSLLM